MGLSKYLNSRYLPPDYVEDAKEFLGALYRRSTPSEVDSMMNHFIILSMENTKLYERFTNAPMNDDTCSLLLLTTLYSFLRTHKKALEAMMSIREEGDSFLNDTDFA